MWLELERVDNLAKACDNTQQRWEVPNLSDYFAVP